MSPRRIDDGPCTVPIRGVVEGVVVHDDPEAGACVVVGVPRVERREPVTVVTQEPRIGLVLSHVIAGEIEPVGRRLPIRNQRGDVVIDGLVRIGVDLPAHLAQTGLQRLLKYQAIYILILKFQKVF